MFPMTKRFDIDPGPDTPDIVRMIVEIPKHSSNKYEFDSEVGVFKVSRTLYSPIHYPGDYGFVPGTVAEDGDRLDVLCMVNSPSYPGILIYVRPVAVLDMIDQDQPDHKILTVPNRDPRYDSIASISTTWRRIRGGRSSTSSTSTKNWKVRSPGWKVGGGETRPFKSFWRAGVASWIGSQARELRDFLGSPGYDTRPE